MLKQHLDVFGSLTHQLQEWLGHFTAKLAIEASHAQHTYYLSAGGTSIFTNLTDFCH